MHAAAAEQASASESLQDLNKDTFQPFLEEAGDKLVVVDFYTDWCVPLGLPNRSLGCSVLACFCSGWPAEDIAWSHFLSQVALTSVACICISDGLTWVVHVCTAEIRLSSFGISQSAWIGDFALVSMALPAQTYPGLHVMSLKSIVGEEMSLHYFNCWCSFTNVC